MKKLWLFISVLVVFLLFLGGRCKSPKPLAEGDVLWSAYYFDPEDPSELADFSSRIFAIGSGNQVYIPSSEIPALLALNSTNGRRNWEFVDPEEEEFAITATINDDGTIFIGTEEGKFYALTSSGTVKCSTRFTSPIVAPPSLGIDGTLILQTDDDTLFALEPNSLNRKWSFFAGGGRFPAVVSPDGTVFIAQDESLFALEPDSGKVKWRCKTKQVIMCSPTIDVRKGICYVVDEDGWLVAINLNDGNKEWERAVGESPSAPVIGNQGTIYLTTTDRLMALNPEDQSEKWAYFFPQNYTPSMPAVSEHEVVYFLAVGNGADSLYAINDDGTKRWATALDVGEPTDDFVSAPKIDDQGYIYIGSGNRAWCVVGKGKPAGSSWPMFQGDGKNSGRVQ